MICIYLTVDNQSEHQHVAELFEVNAALTTASPPPLQVESVRPLSPPAGPSEVA